LKEQNGKRDKRVAFPEKGTSFEKKPPLK